MEEWTLERLLKTVVKEKLGFEAPTVLIDGDILWEEGDGADSEDYMVNLPKTLAKLPCGGIQHGTVFELDDTTQNLSIEVTVTHQKEWPQDEETEEFPFLIGAAPPKAKPAAPPTAEESKSPAAAKPEANDDDDDVLVLSDDEGEPTKKRRSEEGGDAGPDAKKTKIVAEDDDIIVID